MTRGSLIVLALALAAQVSYAQAPAPNPAAEAALAEGRRLYDLQEWDKAIAKFKDSYTLREDAPALFNIAQSYRLKGDCAQAASFYKTFKRKFPKEKNIAKVEKFITDMEACAKAAKSEPTGTEPTAEPTKPEPTKSDPTKSDPTKSDPTKSDPTKSEPLTGVATDPTTPRDDGGGGSGGLRVASYVTLGAGGAGLMIGVLYGAKAMGAANEAEELAVGATWKPGIEERGQRNEKIAMVSLFAGGALVAGGVVMFVLSRPSPSSERSTVTIVPTDEGASFVWAGKF